MSSTNTKDIKMVQKQIVNFVKNSFHIVESFFSVGDENVVFTEDSKCFPINEVEIVEMDTVTDCLLDSLTDDIVMSLLEDPDTGEKLVW